MSPLVQAIQYQRGFSLDVFAAFGQTNFNLDADGRLWYFGKGHEFCASHGDWIIRERSGRLVCVTNAEFKQRYQEVA